MFEHLSGRALDRYHILRPVSSDRLGTRFRAQDPTLQRDVAILVIDPEAAASPGFAQDFAHAAREAARLDHPSLLDVYDFKEPPPYYYIVMEYIAGGSLEGLLDILRRSGRWLRLDEAVGLVHQLALALQYVREAGVPQRSVAPETVMIKPVQVNSLPYLPVLTDLGLARLVNRGPGEGAPPAYLSPEAALGRTTGPRSDVYSLGVLLFELVTGQLPFPVETLDDAVRYHTRQPLPSLRLLRPDIPGSLETILMNALEKNPEARFADPASLSAELERVLPDVDAVRTPPPAFESAVSLMAPYRQSLVEPPAVEAFTPPEEHPGYSQTVPNAAYIPPVRGALEILLEEAQLSVEPGGSVSTAVEITNGGQAEARVSLEVDGLPRDWVTAAPEQIQMAPGERRSIRLTIHPARSPLSRAGRYPITVRASDRTSPGRFAEARATLSVGAFSEFTADLQTPRMAANDTGQIAINNLSNTQETFNLVFRDPANELVFTAPLAQIRLAEGQSGLAEFRPSLRQPHWVGSDKLIPFTVQVQSASGETKTHRGEVLSRPVVPIWVVAVLSLLFICFIGTLGLVLSRSGLESTRQTQTVIAQQTGLAVGLLGTAQAQTETAEFLANANQATIQAVTATAAWQAADDDGDGLPNQREVELGTLPGDPDTDKDGLPDGEEVRRTTDPLRPDSDGDGISDSDEVRRGLNPLEADTDGDGIPDGEDQAPLQTSTPAPDLNATQQAAAAQTAAVQATQQAAQQATAAANQAAAQTATAAAQAAAAQTATAQAQATRVVGQGQRVAFIHLAGTADARDFQALLQANGFQVDLIPQDAILSTDFSEYQAIMIGSDTGSEGVWGDDEGTWANYVLATELPVIGLGEGGFAYFGRIDLSIGWENGIAGNASSVYVVDPAAPAWTAPFPIQVPGNNVVALYNNNTSLAAVTAETPPQGVTLIGRLPDDATHYPIARQGANLLWGFSAGPGRMSATGMQVFLNLLVDLLP